MLEAAAAEAATIEAPTCPMTGQELYRFLDDFGALISVRADGSTWLQTLDDRRWRCVRRKADDVSLERWTNAKLRQKRALADAAPWRLGVDEIPSLDELEEWASDGICPTVDGEHTVEPDGHGPTGCPSWLLALGIL